jgi:hypothetical protein
MFGRVAFAADAENLLRGGNSQIVNARGPEMAESCAETCTRERGQRHAPAATMQIQAESRAPAADVANRGLQNGIDIRVSAEHRSEPIFHNDADAQVGAMLLQKLQSRGGKNTVTQ